MCPEDAGTGRAIAAAYQIGPNISEGSSSAPERCCVPISAAGDRISSLLAVLILDVKSRGNGGAVNGWSPSYLEELVEAHYIIKVVLFYVTGVKQNQKCSTPAVYELKVVVLICE